MASGPKARVSPVPVAPPRHSLFNSIDPTREPDERWANGFRYPPERCGGGGIIAPCSNAEKELDSADNEDNISYEPFAVWAGAMCNTLDPEFGIREGQARARRLLAACESKHAATEFWEGAFADAQGWDNFYLTRAGATLLSDSVGVSARHALACLEQSIAECHCGDGIIHANRQVFTLWKSFDLVTVTTDWRAYTYLGTQVIADAGYTGTAPTGTTDANGVSWAFATGPLQLRLGQVRDVGSTPAQVVNRSTNDAILRAERAVAITTDACCHSAIGVQVYPCLNLESGS